MYVINIMCKDRCHVTQDTFHTEVIVMLCIVFVDCCNVCIYEVIGIIIGNLYDDQASWIEIVSPYSCCRYNICVATYIM